MCAEILVLFKVHALKKKTKYMQLLACNISQWIKSLKWQHEPLIAVILEW